MKEGFSVDGAAALLQALNMSFDEVTRCTVSFGVQSLGAGLGLTGKCVIK